MQYVIDTHALIWFFEDDSRLSSAVKAVLLNPDSQLILPAIALAEAVWIIDRGKTGIPDLAYVFDAVLNDPRITVYPLNPAVIRETFHLDVINEMHDRQIVATALVIQKQGQNVKLMTCDRNITQSAVINVLW
jgi:PIN domain nuclease of toxin-antitoxin system